MNFIIVIHLSLKIIITVFRSPSMSVRQDVYFSPQTSIPRQSPNPQCVSSHEVRVGVRGLKEDKSKSRIHTKNVTSLKWSSLLYFLYNFGLTKNTLN